MKSQAGMGPWRRAGIGLAALMLLTGLAAFMLDRLDRAFPPPLEQATDVSRQVVDRNGRLLRAYTTEGGVWRLPVSLDDVDPDYIEMLIAYEDRRFRTHPGIDPAALVRAAVQLVLNGGRIVSGGSTITMQLARLIEPRSERSVPAKLRQMARALQIERRMSKDEILSLYLTLAPYGGNLEGVRAASLAWFGREPKKLTLSQSALLVALPQSPESRRPDRQQAQARLARNRVLARMSSAGLIPESEIERASVAKIPDGRKAMPDLAAHTADLAILSRSDADVITLTLDAAVQQRLELLATETAGRLGPRQSLAMVLADAATGEILASVGSTGHLDTGRAGAIDMTRATRSPGSTLKPFIYGLAFEDALVAPETLIDDTPADFAGYRPRNFDRGYMGEVSIREALQFSLNVPAVRLLEAVGPQRLLSRFRRAGIQLELPPGGMPGLAIGLGGAGVSLRDLVQLYSAFANNGTARMLRDGTETAPSRLSRSAGDGGGRRVARRRDTLRCHRAARSTSYCHSLQDRDVLRLSRCLGGRVRRTPCAWSLGRATRCRPCPRSFGDRDRSAAAFRGLCAQRAGSRGFSGSSSRHVGPGTRQPAVCPQEVPQHRYGGECGRRRQPPTADRLSAAGRARGARIRRGRAADAAGYQAAGRGGALQADRQRRGVAKVNTAPRAQLGPGQSGSIDPDCDGCRRQGGQRQRVH
jgi:membrane carboxypeptidase/penicillin-binding protein PbpC